MKVSIEDIKQTIKKLEDLVAEMECNDLTEVETEGNTYWCGSNYISFGRNGFLDIESALEKIWQKEGEEYYE